MSSYSKQMMEIARQWLAVNPDAADPFLRIPNLDKDRPVHETREQMLARMERAAGHMPGTSPLLAKLRDISAQADDTARDLHQKESVLERAINHPGLVTPSQHKGTVDQVRYSHLGRWFLAWGRHGFNVFDLSADFTAAMLLTDARELDVTRVRLPFAGLLMIIPDGFARGAEGGHYTKIHVCEIPRAHVAELAVMNKVADELDKLSADQAREVLTTAERKSGSVSPATALLTRSPDPDDVVLHIHATDGARVLATFIDRRGLSWGAFDALPDDVADDADRQCRHTLRRIVFGALAYATVVDRAIEERASSGRTRGASSDAPRRWDLGRTIRLDPRLIRAARAGSREIALHVKARYIVRGHYRNQAHGVRWSERKSIWITPFYKGPEEGAALVHTYKLEEGPKS